MGSLAIATPSQSSHNATSTHRGNHATAPQTKDREPDAPHRNHHNTFALNHQLNRNKTKTLEEQTPVSDLATRSNHPHRFGTPHRKTFLCTSIARVPPGKQNQGQV